MEAIGYIYTGDQVFGHSVRSLKLAQMVTIMKTNNFQQFLLPLN